MTRKEAVGGRSEQPARGPISPGSPLHRLLEIIAWEIGRDRRNEVSPPKERDFGDNQRNQLPSSP